MFTVRIIILNFIKKSTGTIRKLIPSYASSFISATTIRFWINLQISIHQNKTRSRISIFLEKKNHTNTQTHLNQDRSQRQKNSTTKKSVKKIVEERPNERRLWKEALAGFHRLECVRFRNWTGISTQFFATRNAHSVRLVRSPVCSLSPQFVVVYVLSAFEWSKMRSKSKRVGWIGARFRNGVVKFDWWLKIVPKCRRISIVWTERELKWMAKNPGNLMKGNIEWKLWMCCELFIGVHNYAHKL